MPSDSIITVEGLGKRYRLGASGSGERYTALRDVIANSISAPFRRLRNGRQRDNGPTGQQDAPVVSGPVSNSPSSPVVSGQLSSGQRTEEFWALRDINFEVKQGEVLGIIGRNGAGKSTLLKILSRITEPTEGRIKIKGRVASLLEVGTGFHPELTGRENIFLNGAILGMHRHEIKAKFDEIVAFAEVEKFLDTPVKRYSSGMYVRLAFAVAAHLDPDILIIDEVLAVGDADFQKKCLQKIKSVAESGARTVLFVSHNMAAILNLTEHSLLFDRGELAFQGTTRETIGRYFGDKERGPVTRRLSDYRPSWATPTIVELCLLNGEAASADRIPLGGDISIEMRFDSGSNPVRRPVMGVVIHSLTAGTVGGVNTRMMNYETRENFLNGVFRCRLSSLPLLQGQYSIDVWLGDGPRDIDTATGYLTFEIEEADVYSSGKVPFRDLGVVYFQPQWELSDS